ncbi:MAG: pilus assembly PilX N-terminal domain-containing protein [Deltaproteobacteria bacterium]|nr:pilus assembly PilX N-terminal domain-containing protein [Deltaproteobacteria bacterium]
MLLIHKNENGMILVLVLSFLAILSLLGATAVIVTTTDIKIGGNYKASVQAFYDADAGVNYAIARIEDGLANNTLALVGSSVTVNYTAPAGFYFDNITTLTQVGATNKYSFQVTGHSGNASSTIELVFVRDSLFQYGAFGNEQIDINSNGAVYSYDSRVTPNPKPEDSTGEGDVGSNEKVHVHKDTYIDGDVGLGDDGAGTEAVYKESGTPTITGDIDDVDRVDPDPLGAIGGDLANDFKKYSTNNNNASAKPPIDGNTINLDKNNTMTLKAGNYYLTSIKLNNGSTLNIDTTDGPVNIYLSGDAEFDAKKGSSIKNTGNPTDLTMYSDSKKKIDFTHCTAFKGAIYAPYADIDVNDAYGMIWAKKVDIKESGVVYFDTALKDKWRADTVSIVSWREILN